MRVLLLGGGTQGLALARCLYCAKFEVFFLGEKNNYADKSRYIKKRFYSSFAFSSIDYKEYVLKIISEEGIDVIIPTGDAQSEFLSKNIDALQGKVHYKLPPLDIFKKATDKNKLMQMCEEKCYPHPLTLGTSYFSNLNSESFKKFPYPALIKPNITCGGRGMTLVNTYAEFLDRYPIIHKEYGECHLQQFIKEGGAQVEIQLYVNEEKQLVNSSVIYKYRWYPEKGGSSCCAVSIKNDKIVERLYQLLLDLGWVGFADFDTIEDPDTGELLIMELNPRVPACVKTAVVAGINWGEIIVNEYTDQKQKQYDYKEGEFLRHLGFETLWFIKSRNRFSTKPNWFKLLGKHIHYQDMSDWTDPMPFISGTFNNIFKLLLHKEKEKINR